MSRIDELIAEHCPAGVEFALLGDIARLVRGNGMPRKDLTTSGVGAIHYGDIYTRYGVWATETFFFVPHDKAARLARVEAGDLIVTNTSENLDDVGKAVAWLGEDPIVTGGHATVVKHDQDPKFLSYWFGARSFDQQKRRLAGGTKVIDISSKKLAMVRVPVPPLTVQREIVRVLDTFLDLEAQLESELEARRLQFSYYRDRLVAESTSERKPMGEVGQFVRGRRFTKKDIVPSGIPSIHYGEIYTHYGTSACEAINQIRTDLGPQLSFAVAGDVVIACVSETVEDVGKAVAWLGGDEVAIHDDTFLFRSSMDPKFVVYALQTPEFQAQKVNHVTRAKVKRLSGRGLAKIKIPVPGIAEQKRVVSMLDNFDALLNDCSIGLPAEIASRRRQYEHYRDKLLTFEEAH